MRLYYKKIERCVDCPEKIMRELRLDDKKIPYSKNANFCSVTNQELFDEIPTSCPLMEYQEKIEANETGNVWVKIKDKEHDK